MLDWLIDNLALIMFVTMFFVKMRSAWEEVIVEESAKDPDFKRAHESYAAFRKQYAIWKEHGYLK